MDGEYRGADNCPTPGPTTGRPVAALLGPEPVPVFAHIGTSADEPGWPNEIHQEWLTRPVGMSTRQ